MAPTGQREQISHIDDLDSANTGTNVYKREKSVNLSAVNGNRPKCVEHDVPNLPEIANIQQKLYPEKGEDVLDDGLLFDDLYLPDSDEIECLGGNRHDSSSSVTSLDECCLSRSFSKSWKSSSGKGKKRKKKNRGKKKVNNKRQKTDIFMASANEMGSMSCEEECITCKKTVGDGKTSTKGGCISTPKPQSRVAGKGKVSCSNAQTRGGGGQDDGDDEDDDKRNKPPRRPPDDMLFRKTQKPKKKKAGSDMEVDSEDSSNTNDGNQAEIQPGRSSCDQEMVTELQVATQPQRPPQQQPPQQQPPQQQPPQQQPPQQQPPQQQPPQHASNQFLGRMHSCINHYNYCHSRPCVRCHRVEVMFMQHYFVETNGMCNCTKCQLASLALKFHSSKCQIPFCKVCMRAKNMACRPAAAPVVVPPVAAQAGVLNIPVCGPSLDPEDQICWKEDNFPQDISHFKEDVDYICLDTLGKGGHGEVSNVQIPDDVKKKCFGSDYDDIVMKKSKNVGDDEKYMLQQTSRHPNLVRTFCVVQKQPNEYRTFMEKCKTSLREYLNKLVEEGGCMEIHEAMFYWSQIMDALKFLHHLRVPVAHKDIKAENVLLSVKDNLVQVKLADYDTVKKLNNLFTKPGLKAKGTHGLVSPEVLRQMSHGRPADVYSMGMFLFQMLFPQDFKNLQIELQQSFRNPSELIVRHHCLVERFLLEKMPILHSLDEELAELIQTCLEEEQSRRPTAPEVLQHPAVTKYTRRQIDMRQLIEQIAQI